MVNNIFESEIYLYEYVVTVDNECILLGQSIWALGAKQKVVRSLNKDTF